MHVEGSRLSFVDAGVITSDPKHSPAARLLSLHEGLAQVLARHSPHAAAMEETFVNKNSLSSLKLAQARGALMLTLAQHGLMAVEYPANTVKKSVVGAGHADKEQVAHMVRVLLPGCRDVKADAADALAVAITHAHAHKVAG